MANNLHKTKALSRLGMLVAIGIVFLWYVLSNFDIKLTGTLANIFFFSMVVMALVVAVTFFVSLSSLPLWLTLPGAGLAVTGAVMLALPRVKAAWIAILWSMGKVGDSQE